jgi:hypothetical protein
MVISMSVVLLGRGNQYVRIGPHAELALLSIPIDTWGRYWLTVALLSLTNAIAVFSSEVVQPAIEYPVYNPAHHHISRYSKIELFALTNVKFTCTSVRQVFVILISVTQIDLALWQTLTGSILSCFCVWFILGTKTFQTETDHTPTDTTTELAMLVADREIQSCCRGSILNSNKQIGEVVAA